MASRTITMYRWEDGEILEQEVEKSDAKYTLGWRTEPDEAMRVQLSQGRYIFENEINKLKKLIDNLINLENDLEDIGIVDKLPKKRVENIKVLNEKLNLLLENNMH